MIYKAVEVIWIFLAGGTGIESTIRGPREPKNIAHVMSICTFDQCCICVFVFEVLVSSPFRKYMVCMV